MTPRSLRLRLMMLASIWVLLSLLATFYVLHHLFTTNIELSERQDLAAAMTRLIALVNAESPGIRLTEPMVDPRYQTPLGGRYWQVEALDSGDILRSPSLFDHVLSVPTGRDMLLQQVGPDRQPLLMLTRMVVLEDGSAPRALQMTIAIDYALTQGAIQRYTGDLIRLLAVLALVILTAAWLIVLLGLRPLEGLRGAIDAVRKGKSPRIGGRFPHELTPLIEEVNTLLDEREANTERMKARAADLAHGLKTPLAAIHGIAERLEGGGVTDEARMLMDLNEEMTARIEYQLRLSTIRLRASEHVARSALNQAVLRTIAVLKKGTYGESLQWIAELGPECEVNIHRQDLMELIGTILENAAKWANGTVIVRSWTEPSSAVLLVVDDGPGVTEAQIGQLGRRGLRHDLSRPGTGLGLAIASEIIALNGAAMTFGTADLGGLAVTITLPLAPAP